MLFDSDVTRSSARQNDGKMECTHSFRGEPVGAAGDSPECRSEPEEECSVPYDAGLDEYHQESCV